MARHLDLEVMCRRVWRKPYAGHSPQLWDDPPCGVNREFALRPNRTDWTGVRAGLAGAKPGGDAGHRIVPAAAGRQPEQSSMLKDRSERRRQWDVFP